MWFGLLGAFTVRNDTGEELDLGPPQRRELLAFLLSNPNRPVSVDSIIDALWPDGAPGGARASVQSHVSRLRRVLGPERIVTRSPGYLVRVAADTFDVLDFLQSVQDGQKLASGGSYRRAFEELSRGLLLWRGEPLWDFAYSDWAQLEVSRLEIVRQTGVRERFNLALALGLHDEVLPELATLSDLTPGDEALTRMHAIALYRSGRQHEALHRVAALRIYLAEELGLDPSPETEELELAILQHDTLLTVPNTGQATSPLSQLAGRDWYERDTLAFDQLELRETGDPPRTWDALDPWLHRDQTRSSRRLTNLPAQLTSFVGRAEEMGALEALVRARRLVTVTGPAGVGKTRLALQVAAELAGDLPDGVWLAELASVDDPELIPLVVLQAMGVGRSGTKAPALLLDVLEDRQVLLLVDNCEHLIDPAANLIESVLKRAPGVKVLTTSREPLGIPGEFLYPLAPLNVPDIENMSEWNTPDRTVDAIELFVDRGRAVAPFALDETSGPLVAAICRRLDGLPLALELAAAQVDHLTLEELSALLETELSALESPYRTVPTRQRTIQAAVDWSYRLLTPLEQAAFRRLAVFTGDFDLEAAETVCDFRPLAGEIVPLLDRLVKRSVLTRFPNGRYRLLQVLRHAAVQELRQAGEDNAVTTAHSRHYLDEAAEALAYTHGPQQVGWINRIDLDWPNIRTALHWALQHDPEKGAEAVIGLTDYFRVDHGWDGIEWTNHYLEIVDDSRIVLELHKTRALAAMNPAVHDIMVESAEFVLDHPAQIDDEAVIDALAVLGMKAFESGESDLVSEVATRMMAVGLDTPRAQRRLANVKAFVCLLSGDLEGAAQWNQRAFDLIPVTGELWGKVGTGNNLADTVMRLGRLGEALTIIDEAIGVGRELGSRFMLSLSLITRAEILYRAQRYREALDSAFEGLELAHRVSSRFEIIMGAEIAAALLLALEQINEAATLHSFSHAHAEEWAQEGVLSQFSVYHEALVAELDGLPSEQGDRAIRRALTTPLPILIDQIRILSAPSS